MLHAQSCQIGRVLQAETGRLKLSMGRPLLGSGNGCPLLSDKTMLRGGMHNSWLPSHASPRVPSLVVASDFLAAAQRLVAHVEARHLRVAVSLPDNFQGMDVSWIANACAAQICLKHHKLFHDTHANIFFLHHRKESDETVIE